MSFPPRLTEDCYCRRCQKHFIFVDNDGKCPRCQAPVQSEDIITKGGLGHEEPASVVELREHMETPHL